MLWTGTSDIAGNWAPRIRRERALLSAARACKGPRRAIGEPTPYRTGRQARPRLRVASDVPGLASTIGQVSLAHSGHRGSRSGGELPVTLADARAAIELCTALYHAARTREPVSLPIAADHPLYGGWQPRARP